MRDIKGKISTETRYYISSLNEKPQKILNKVRSHWAIENSVHWVLDMSFGETNAELEKIMLLRSWKLFDIWL